MILSSTEWTFWLAITLLGFPTSAARDDELAGGSDDNAAAAWRRITGSPSLGESCKLGHSPLDRDASKAAKFRDCVNVRWSVDFAGNQASVKLAPARQSY
jgi:hypothetical protein